MDFDGTLIGVVFELPLGEIEFRTESVVSEDFSQPRLRIGDVAGTEKCNNVLAKTVGLGV